MPEADGDIVIRYIELPFGRRDIAFSWKGGKVARIDRNNLGDLSISSRGIKPGSIIVLGPLRLRVIEIDERWQLSYWVMRDGMRAWLRYKTRWLSRGLHWIYIRLILTAYVWGLARGAAEWPEYRIPSWRDVHLLRRIFGDES